ncbi:type II secretion system major pseudopilin GspG [Mesorhizobium sp. 1M-11]|uniref:type II secretion system major pseudopilin GspG n=1 Tax=Mesorhizobium sp. 1M-11 TaxID=1529006 RepID=UPI0009E9C666|nr:type II secretion system major pseudopilin GspG [Mesorhizobium sp. 1M-11]
MRKSRREAALRQKRSPDRSGSEAGFTLVELLVVLAIIALIATLAAPQVLKYLGSSRTSASKAQINNLESALELYYLDNGRYPSDEEGLPALVSAPQGAAHWNGPYLKGNAGLQDPWGRAYIYAAKQDGSGVSIKSLGRDGKPEGTGEDQDIGN